MGQAGRSEEDAFMEGGERKRRRIDRVTAPDLLDALTERSPEEIRALRDDCRLEEARLSYTRRLLQGRLDIARAEAVRRGGEGEGDLIASLAAILADDPSPRASGPRAAPVYAPTDEGGRRRDDSLVDDSTLGRLPDLDDDELARVIQRIEADEREVSGLRRNVLGNLDALQAELVRRYREGRVGVDDIVASAVAEGSQAKD